jgi:hypothetical protein
MTRLLLNAERAPAVQNSCVREFIVTRDVTLEGGSAALRTGGEDADRGAGSRDYFAGAAIVWIWRSVLA